MNIRNILAVARKDALDTFSNTSTVVALLMPILMALLFFMLTQIIGGHTTQILVYNPGNSALVNVVSHSFSNVQVTTVNSPQDVQAAFGTDGTHKSSSYALGLVIPANFDADLKANRHPQVTLYTNGDNINNIDKQDTLFAINTYARSLASPQPAAQITTITINPPASITTATYVGQGYAVTGLMVVFLTGLSIIPNLLIEEKEKKTLRMLMVSPASFTDVVVGKLLLGLIYQVVLGIIVMTILGGFTGQVGVILLFMFLGCLFSLTLGLLFGSIFQTAGAAGGVSGIVSFLFFIPSIFVGGLGQLFGNNSIAQIVKILPTYYIADGLSNSIQNKVTTGNLSLDLVIVLGSALVLLAVAIWSLRRQAAVAATI